MKRIVITVVFLAALPLLASTNAPSGAIAFAGHTSAGNWCQCGCPGCFCDPGEQVEMCIPGRDTHTAEARSTTPIHPGGSSGTAAAMLIGALGFLWKRFRR